MNVQLANTYDPSKNYNVSNWYASPKLDGVRAVFIPEKGLLTRNNKPLNGFNHMAEVLEKICTDRKLSFIDGELVITGRSFQASQGVILASEHDDKSLVEFHVFAVGGDFTDTASMLNAIPEDRQNNIFRVNSEFIPNTFQAIEDACRKFTDLGYEGVMLRNPETAYYNGRNDCLLKYKFFNEADLEIIEVNSDRSVTVQGKINGLDVRANVRFSGENLTGQILSVKYQSITDKTDKQGFYSLRFPSAIGIKQDRDFQAAPVQAKLKSKSENKAKGITYYKNGIVEAVFSVNLIYRPKKAASKAEMSVWKNKLFQCRSIQEAEDLFAELKLTIPKIMEFAKYLGVGLKGCKYLKAEIIRRVINASLGVRLTARKWLLIRKFLLIRRSIKLTQSEMLSLIRDLRRGIDSMSQKLNALEDSLFQLAKPYEAKPEEFNHDKEAWLTVREVCEALKISQATFYEYVKNGLFPTGFEFGPRSKRWKLSDIEAWQKSKHVLSKDEIKRRNRVSRIRQISELCHV